MRIHAAAELYARELRIRRSSDSLLLQSARALDRLAGQLRETRIRDVRLIGEEHVTSFARTLRESPLALSTQASYLQRIKSFFGFLVRQGLLLRDPSADLAIPLVVTLPRTVLTERQAEKLVNTPSPSTSVGKRDRAILETLYGTGIRRGECARLDVADVDLYSGTLLVRNGKGRKDRLVPIPERSARALDLYLRETRPLLLSRVAEPALFLTAWRGRRLSIGALVQMLQRHARAAKLERVHLHALRHTCATHLLRGGADIRHVQQILGHAHIHTTSRYAHVSLLDLRRVIARAHPRETVRRYRRTAVQ